MGGEFVWESVDIKGSPLGVVTRLLRRDGLLRAARPLGEKNEENRKNHRCTTGGPKSELDMKNTPSPNSLFFPKICDSACFPMQCCNKL
jgi:hypothetical protein